MLCKKCRKEISEGSLYCNFCGKKQETTKRKVRRRPRGAGCIRHRTDCRDNPYIAYTPATIGGAGERYLGALQLTHRLRLLLTSTSTAFIYLMAV